MASILIPLGEVALWILRVVFYALMIEAGFELIETFFAPPWPPFLQHFWQTLERFIELGLDITAPYLGRGVKGRIFLALLSFVGIKVIRQNMRK